MKSKAIKALILISVLLLAGFAHADNKRTISDVNSVKALATSSTTYKLPNPTSEYCIRVNNGNAWLMVGGSGVTATTTVGSGFTLYIPDGGTYCSIFKPTTTNSYDPIYIAFIGDNATGFINFLQRN